MRRVIENAFDILAARRRVFQKPIRATVENVESYTLVCLALHNYLRLTENTYYSPAGFVDSESSIGRTILRKKKKNPEDWLNDVNEELCNGFSNARKIHGSKYSLGAIEMRENLKNYLNSKKGSVLWPLDYVRRTAH